MAHGLLPQDLGVALKINMQQAAVSWQPRADEEPIAVCGPAKRYRVLQPFTRTSCVGCSAQGEEADGIFGPRQTAIRVPSGARKSSRVVVVLRVRIDPRELRASPSSPDQRREDDLLSVFRKSPNDTDFCRGPAQPTKAARDSNTSCEGPPVTGFS